MTKKEALEITQKDNWPSEGTIEQLIEQDGLCAKCGRDLSEENESIWSIDGQIICNSCEDDYREYCPICESHIRTDELEKSNHIVIVREFITGNTPNKIAPGIYRIVERPHWMGYDTTCWNGTIEGKIELVNKIDLETLDDESGPICSECVEKYTTHSGIIRLQGTPIILFKEYYEHSRNSYSDAEIHEFRINWIHERINERGLIQSGIDKARRLPDSKKLIGE